MSDKVLIKNKLLFETFFSHSEELSIDGRIVLEWILEKHDEKVWPGFIWLSIGTSGGLL
jgi:hypothetical protein